MAQQKKNTLQIKNMRGVDRFVEGTQQEPDLFYQLQNMNVPNPGEMKAISGVTKLNSTALAGVNKILHAKFLDTKNEKDLCILYEPTTALPSAPTGYTFTTNAGAAQVRDVYIEYISPGGGRIATLYAAKTFGLTGGLTVNIPAISDNLVRSINIWATDDFGNIIWVGGAYRVNGSFPASVIVYPPFGVTALTTQVTYYFPSSHQEFVPTTGGTIQSDRTYFFGLGPWETMPSYNTATEVQFNSSTTPSLPMSCYVPAGKSAINFTFDFCPYDLINSVSSPLNGDLPMRRALVYMGTTPEDMMPCGPTAGGSTTYERTQVSYTVTDASSSDVSLNPTNTIFISGYSIPVGAILKYNTGAGSITGLTNNSYYYVVSSVQTTSGSTVKLGTTPALSSLVLLTAKAAGTVFFRWSKVTGTVLNLPNSLEIISSAGSVNTSVSALYPVANDGRTSGYATLRWQNLNPFLATPSSASTTPYEIACMVFTSLDPSSRRDVLRPFQQYSVDLSNYQSAIVGLYLQTVGSTNVFSIPVKDASNNKIDWNFESRQYGNRLWIADGYNEPFYTNGYVFKAGIPSLNSGGDTFARWPITSFIEFYKDRMILASGNSNQSSKASGNQTYQPGWFYYSKVSTGSSDIQNFNYNSTTPNAISVSTGDQSEIVGLNVYSQDLTTVGAESFLVIGKEQVVMTWDGNLTSAAKQISKATGLAGPTAYSLTKFGPVFVGNDNVYLFRTSQDVVPIGDSVKDIIKGLTKEQLRKISVVYHDEDIKIGYSTDVNLDSELWLRLRYENGGIQKAWSGPHKMKEYTNQAVILNFDSNINVRVSFLETDLFRRDDPGSFLNDTQDIARVIKIRNLGLQQDHLLKLITDSYMALRTVQDEDFDLTLESEDGSQSIVVQTTAFSSGNQKKLKQIQIPQRFLARVFSLTIENTSNGDLSIYDLSILYETLRRRLIP